MLRDLVFLRADFEKSFSIPLIFQFVFVDICCLASSIFGELCEVEIPHSLRIYFLITIDNERKLLISS